jgi:hypothetical protein
MVIADCDFVCALTEIGCLRVLTETSTFPDSLAHANQVCSGILTHFPTYLLLKDLLPQYHEELVYL